MLTFNLETKGIPTLRIFERLNVIYSDLDWIFLSKLSSVFCTANTPLVAEVSPSSLMYNVASTREDMMGISNQFWRISRFLLNLENFILKFCQKSRTDLAI